MPRFTCSSCKNEIERGQGGVMSKKKWKPGTTTRMLLIRRHNDLIVEFWETTTGYATLVHDIDTKNLITRRDSEGIKPTRDFFWDVGKVQHGTR